MNINEMSDTQLEALLRDPDLFLWQFDGSRALFVKMDRNAYLNSIFCDQRVLATSQEVAGIECSRLGDRISGANLPAPRINYVFHVAHCGSTLLSRALDLKDGNIVYREPAVLRQLAAEYAAGFYGKTPPAEWRSKLELSVALLNRTYKAGSPVVVKANVPVNFMLPALLQYGADHRVLFLYLGLENYLLAVLKSPHHRAWVASISNELAPAIEAVAAITPDERGRQSVAEAAACLWMVQISIFNQIAADRPDARTLDAEDFYGDPGHALAKCFDFFRQPVEPDTVKGIAESRLFSRYSKDPRQTFDNDMRTGQRDALRQQLSGDIEKARDWISRHIDQCPIPSAMPKPLAKTSGSLLG